MSEEPTRRAIEVSLHELGPDGEALKRTLGLATLPFVWQLECEGITSYAVGTKHNEPHAYTHHINQLLAQVKRVCLEITPDMLVPEQTRAVQLETTDLFKRYLLTCTDEKLISELTSLTTRLMGRQTLEELAAGKLPGVDGDILDLAQTGNIPTYALETHEERHPYLIQLHNGFRTTITLAELIPALVPRLLEEMSQALDEQDRAYRSGKLLSQTTRRLRQEDPLLIERNIIMAYRSLEHMVETPTLLAAGNAHFTGPEPTMLTLYQEKGITVKRI